ncbi:GNAT family N-acetyltransferase [Aquimarina addita]|uniref:GNAT family N-acetyltransferase n=1 Tax=Aquimarina addita TaxID=870485 RepID=A0ABP6UMC2_9FLAO
MEITLKELNNKGYAIAKDDGNKMGMMTYSTPGKDFIIIDHTEVEEAGKGKGIGKLLLYKIVEMARDKNIKILPLCPFAKAMFKKIEEIRDVLK